LEQAKHIFKNKKVLIMGLGTKGGGVVSAKFAHKHGAEVTITDMQPEARLKESLDQLTLVPKNLY
jgi:UDP-N-acetylmuramoylalanine-D-glutamate ligase